MKRKLMTIAVTGALAFGGLVIANPANAATGSITVAAGGSICKYTASKVTSGVVASNGNCSRVGAAVKYMSAAGNAYWTPNYLSPAGVVTKAPSGTTYLSGTTTGTIVQGAAEHLRTQTV